MSSAYHLPFTFILRTLVQLLT